MIVLTDYQAEDLLQLGGLPAEITESIARQRNAGGQPENLIEEISGIVQRVIDSDMTDARFGIEGIARLLFSESAMPRNRDYIECCVCKGKIDKSGFSLVGIVTNSVYCLSCLASTSLSDTVTVHHSCGNYWSARFNGIRSAIRSILSKTTCGRCQHPLNYKLTEEERAAVNEEETNDFHTQPWNIGRLGIPARRITDFQDWAAPEVPEEDGL